MKRRALLKAIVAAPVASLGAKIGVGAKAERVKELYPVVTPLRNNIPRASNAELDTLLAKMWTEMVTSEPPDTILIHEAHGLTSEDISLLVDELNQHMPAPEYA